jgi:hypothetical protein
MRLSELQTPDDSGSNFWRADVLRLLGTGKGDDI